MPSPVTMDPEDFKYVSKICKDFNLYSSIKNDYCLFFESEEFDNDATSSLLKELFLDPTITFQIPILTINRWMNDNCLKEMLMYFVVELRNLKYVR